MRTVVHWDGDRFFASVEQASDCHLRGRPVVVGGDNRGVVLSASVEARQLGIRPGWPTSRARRASPRLIVLPAHFELYEKFFDQHSLGFSAISTCGPFSAESLPDLEEKRRRDLDQQRQQGKDFER